MSAIWLSALDNLEPKERSRYIIKIFEFIVFIYAINKLFRSEFLNKLLLNTNIDGSFSPGIGTVCKISLRLWPRPRLWPRCRDGASILCRCVWTRWPSECCSLSSLWKNRIESEYALNFVTGNFDKFSLLTKWIFQNVSRSCCDIFILKKEA